MATKKSNKTLLIVAGIGIAAFAAWEIVPKLASKLGGGSGGGSGYSGVGGGGYTEADENGYNPYGYQQPSTLASLLNALGAALNHLSSPSSGSHSSPSGSNSGYGSNTKSGKSSASSYGSNPVADIYNSLVEGLIPSGPDAGQLQGSESNPALGGDSLYDYTPDNSAGVGDYQIPLENADNLLDLSGTDIPTSLGIVGDDSSASDAAINQGYADVQSYDLGSSDFINDGPGYDGTDAGYGGPLDGEQAYGSSYDFGDEGDE